MPKQIATDFINELLISFNLTTDEKLKSTPNFVDGIIAKRAKPTFEPLYQAVDLYSQIQEPEDDDTGKFTKYTQDLTAVLEVLKTVPIDTGKDTFSNIDELNKRLKAIDSGFDELALTNLAASINTEKDSEKGKPTQAGIGTVTNIASLAAFKETKAYTDCFAHLDTIKDVVMTAKEDAIFELKNEEVEIDRLLLQLSALVFNGCLPVQSASSISGADMLFSLKNNINDHIDKVDESIQEALDIILHTSEFQSLEANWRALEYLIDQTDFSKDIKIDLLDVTKAELADDFSENRRDIANGSLFKKIYTKEYDQYGGEPYGAMIGLYEFENTDKDIQWLTTMGKIANAAHCPFISSVGPQFFVNQDDINQLAEIKQLSAFMAQGRFAKWNEFRDSEEAAYLGFTVPRFMIRRPYSMEDNPVAGLSYTEKLKKHTDYCWANAAILFARNLVHSYQATSWCQTIRGPKNGGHIPNLASHVFKDNGLTLTKVPVEIVLPDYRELDCAKAGFMPLVYQKESNNACFFSSQSIKKAKRFKSTTDTENSQLVTDLSYTLSITKIAHYIKCIMRDNIGGTADAAYINNTISNWLSGYVTTVTNPDDLTLRSYPFKAVSVQTVEQEGDVGWYKCNVSVSPHRQFEGLDAELRLETQL